VVIPLWFTTVVEKLEFVDTWSWYELAPLEAFQVSVGFVATPVAPFAGEESVGATGGFTAPADTKRISSKYHVVPVPSAIEIMSSTLLPA